MLERNVTERTGADQELLIAVAVRAEFTLVSVDDGSSHAVETYGEALDDGDKATTKAMSAAYKSAMIQTFCIPVPGNEDADANSRRLSASMHVPEPVQGWHQWARDIGDIVSVCESAQAIDLVQERNRELLKALSREQPDQYARLGEVFTARTATLRERAAKEKASAEAMKLKRRPKREQRTPEAVNA
jgi:hypothetical protein